MTIGKCLRRIGHRFLHPMISGSETEPDSGQRLGTLGVPVGGRLTTATGRSDCDSM